MYKKRECVDKEICLECKYGKENKFTYKKYTMADLNKSS